ncbi:CsbD family protein [Actinomadura xylanilytica]|nr:CsbD family protein [Actinomadura xylanilytica]MDL4775640.1 CsbD family protein [Actinomadura xylanilytica]
MGDKKDELAGKAKEATGKATGKDELEGEGKADQAKSQAKQTVDEAKHKVSDAKEKMRGMFKGGSKQ